VYFKEGWEYAQHFLNEPYYCLSLERSHKYLFFRSLVIFSSKIVGFISSHYHCKKNVIIRSKFYFVPCPRPSLKSNTEV
jgi:hypothetical protein